MRHLFSLLLLLAACEEATKLPLEAVLDTATISSDADGDGFFGDEDCDDGDAQVNDAAAEVCDGMDNDCDGEVDEDVTLTLYEDTDGDGFGSPGEGTEACEMLEGLASTGNDCDDTRPETFPGAPESCDGEDNDCDGETDEELTELWYIDEDGDGFGESEMSVDGCLPPEGYVGIGEDCDDFNAEVYPEAEEICDERDNDCDGEVDEESGTLWFADQDNDTYGDLSATETACERPEGFVGNSWDCDDLDSFTYPDAIEYCDGLDNNCDGSIDEDSAYDIHDWHPDADGDGYGDPNATLGACFQPTGHVLDASDCDDGRAETNPGATEYCNGHDDDCNGSIDEETAADVPTWYLDGDSDGYGEALDTLQSCIRPSGYAGNASDCDDGRAETNPGATEHCNGHDDDCNGNIDEDTAADAQTWYLDSDGDGYGDETQTTSACSQPAGHLVIAWDCDDSRPETNPAATEYCNGHDDDCNGAIDEDSAADATTWFLDSDGDSFGDPGQTAVSCLLPPGHGTDSTDCDDSRSDTNPAATEYCNGHDDDCDGTVDENTAADAKIWFEDTDEDGFGAPSTATPACHQPVGHISASGDCDDGRSDTNPAATEYCSGHDDNCDGRVDEDTAADAPTWFLDSDSDGFGDLSTPSISCEADPGFIPDSSDCDDGRAESNPAATEYCNGHDDDCDGGTDEDSAVDAQTWFLDSDGDGFGDALHPDVSCLASTGFILDDSDCDDSRADSNPISTEHCNGHDDNCDGSIDEATAVDARSWYLDSDSDGFGDPAVSAISCTPSGSHVADSTDCDDARAESSPIATEYCNGHDDDCDGSTDEDSAADAVTWYQDGDGDGFGTPLVPAVSCYADSGFIMDSSDCDDTSAAAFPGSAEADSPTECMLDADGDGYGDSTEGLGSAPGTDCDDSSATAFPGAAELESSGCMQDSDGDGYGDSSAPAGGEAGSDCDDGSEDVSPSSTEYCNGIDDNCADGIDEDSAADSTVWYLDSDGDGYGASSNTTACSQPGGYAAGTSDCDDGDSGINPGASEVCGNTTDENCSGSYTDGCSSSYHYCGGPGAFNPGQSSGCSMGSERLVHRIRASPGCNDGESGHYTVSFSDGSSESFSAGCGTEVEITPRSVSSMTIRMNSGGGGDSHISWTCCGSSGWGVYHY
jgi:large repetitive protein